MALDPNRCQVADQKAGRGAGLNELAREDQLLHDHSFDGRAHRKLRIDGQSLAIRVMDLALCDSEYQQGLQRVLQVRRSIVVVGLGALEIFLRDGVMLKQIFAAIQRGSLKIHAVARLSIRRGGIRDIRARDIQERLVCIHHGPDIREDFGDRPAHLCDGLRGMVRIPINSAGRAHHERPADLSHRLDLKMRHLVFRHDEQAGLRVVRIGHRGGALLCSRASA